MKSALEAEKQRRKQFYADIDDDMKVEFINGEVIVHSPVKKEHTDVTLHITQLINAFVQIHDIGYVGYEKVMTSFTRNDYEPDVVFFDKSKSKFFKKGMWKFPIPDFVLEVLSKSTETIDRGLKYEDYESHGVKEYWIIDPDKEIVEQYIIKNKKYVLEAKIKKGLISCKVIKGLKLDVRSFFDHKVNLNELKKILG